MPPSSHLQKRPRLQLAHAGRASSVGRHLSAPVSYAVAKHAWSWEHGAWARGLWWHGDAWWPCRDGWPDRWKCVATAWWRRDER